MTVEDKGNFIVIMADEGKVFKSKISGDILTETLYLGCNDSADNYEEVSEVEAYAETESDTVQAEEAECEDGI